MFSFSLNYENHTVPDLAPVSYYKTGMPEFDKLYNGICKEGFTVFGAYPGNGKSLMLLNTAMNVLRNNEDVDIIYISCENSEKTDVERIKKIYGDTIYTGNNTFNYINISREHYALSGAKLDKGRSDIENKIAEIRSVNKDDKSKTIIFIDSPDVLRNTSAFDNETGAYEDLADSLARLGASMPVVTTWHLKSNNTGKPREMTMMSGDDFGRTNRLIQTATTAYIVRKQQGGYSLKIDAKLVKSRNGLDSEAYETLCTVDIK